MSTDYDDAETFDDWAAILRTLLANARAATDSGARSQVSLSLTEFVEKSPNWLAKRLDQVALRAIDALMLADIGSVAQRLESQDRELARLTKVFTAEAAENQAAAKSIRLERVNTALKSSNTAIADIRRLVQSLQDEPDAQDVARNAIAALRSLRDSLEAIEDT